MKILTALLAIAASSPATQFDLVCKGTQKFDGGAATATTSRYRVNLATKKWCEADCGYIREISQVQDGVLVLMDQSVDDAQKQSKQTIEVDRATGGWVSVFVSRRPYNSILTAKGTCQRADFSGFPKVVQKF